MSTTKLDGVFVSFKETSGKVGVIFPTIIDLKYILI